MLAVSIFIFILPLICSLLFTRATRQSSSVRVFRSVRVCVPWEGRWRWCLRACNAQALDWLEPCSSMTLICRVQAREGKMLLSRACSWQSENTHAPELERGWIYCFKLMLEMDKTIYIYIYIYIYVKQKPTTFLFNLFKCLSFLFSCFFLLHLQAAMQNFCNAQKWWFILLWLKWKGPKTENIDHWPLTTGLWPLTFVHYQEILQLFYWLVK